MAHTEDMPQTFTEEYEDLKRDQYQEAKKAYLEDKQSNVKTMKHE